MSKLDDMLSRMKVEEYGVVPKAETKQQIKELMLKLVGEYRDNTNSITPHPEYDDHISVGYNMKIDEIRQKIKDL